MLNAKVENTGCENGGDGLHRRSVVRARTPRAHRAPSGDGWPRLDSQLGECLVGRVALRLADDVVKKPRDSERDSREQVMKEVQWNDLDRGYHSTLASRECQKRQAEEKERESGPTRHREELTALTNRRDAEQQGGNPRETSAHFFASAEMRRFGADE